MLSKRAWRFSWPRFWGLALAAALAAAGQAWAAAPLGLSDWDRDWRRPAVTPAQPPGRVEFVTLGGQAGTVALFPGSDQEPGLLTSRALEVRPGVEYRLGFQLLRPAFQNGHYLSVSLFGREFYLDNHCRTGGWQSLAVSARYEAGRPPTVVWRNDSSSRFLLRGPELAPREDKAGALAEAADAPAWPRFPLGVYGAKPAEWPQVAACGLDLALASAGPERAAGLLEQAGRLGLRLILACPTEPEMAQALARSLTATPPELRPPFFYLVDEPELRSFDPEQLLGLRAILRQELAWAALATAMVRPALVERYAPVYDAVFMDQYPVPSQPLNWLADSVEQSRGLLPPPRQVWAVVQAFSDPKGGWGRVPDLAEMRALALSALAAGARGLLFYTWRQAAAEPSLLADLCQTVRAVRALEGWLPLTPGGGPGLDLSFGGRVFSDPGGGPAVRLGHAQRRGQRLLLAVNVTNHQVLVRLRGLAGSAWARELLQGRHKAVLEGELREALGPLEARAWVIEDKQPGPSQAGPAKQNRSDVSLPRLSPIVARR